MKEFTVIYDVNVQVTKIIKGGDEEKITKLDDAEKKQMENTIKEALGADDVIINNHKVFVGDKANG